MYNKADFLCDMHDGFRDLPKDLEVVEHTRFHNVGAHMAVKALTGIMNPIDKNLYIFDASNYYGTRHDMAACYVYGSDTFGMVTLKFRK